MSVRIRPYYNVSETAAILGVHENTVRNWADRGLLKVIRLPGSRYRRFAVTDIDAVRQQMAQDYPSLDPARVMAGREQPA